MKTLPTHVLASWSLLAIAACTGCFEQSPPAVRPARPVQSAAASGEKAAGEREKESPAETTPPEKSAMPPADIVRPAAEHKFTNDLIYESSPYLLQHAHNPVQWHPWGETAFRLAKEQNKPIFLSIGYSTCYWCHVMERESFENEEVAAILNEHYICIKVDREERPDVDEQYMLATQLSTGRGGWPNSVWLMPDGRPWMAGTYFPRPQFIEGLQKIAEIWKDQPDKVELQANAFAEAIKRNVGRAQMSGGAKLSREVVSNSLEQMKESFDDEHGGFGTRPKFPPHGDLRLLLAEVARAGDAKLLGMATKTLDAIWKGGIHDHVGGGFHRYSTDDHWFLPHFEKMLYDNAQLMRAYTDAHVITSEPLYRESVADIFRWVEREMTHPQGGFYSALDAGDAGEEGVFYVWTAEEISKVLGEEDAKFFADHYGVKPEGNFVEEASKEQPGTNVLFLPQALSDEDNAQLAPLRDQLLAVRNKRAFPRRDDKILASWNGLMISALAHAGHELEEPKYTKAASAAAEFVTTQMIKDGVLQRSWRGDTAKLPGYLDDYAYVIDGLLELHTATDENRWLDAARRLADKMISEFEDDKHGGFFFTSARHDELLIRSKNLTGGGNLPSANGVAAQTLLRLAKLTDEEKYRTAARRTLESVAELMARSPGASEALVLATAQLLDEAKPAVESTADARDEFPPVIAELYAAQLSVTPGQKVAIAVRLDIEEGWHLYGPKPESKFVKPVLLSLSNDASATMEEVKYPPGKEQEDPVLSESVSIYEGEVWLRTAVTIAKDAPLGKAALEFQLSTQACDKSICRKPRTATLKLPIEIAETSTEEPRHVEVFKDK
jgi:uncharacterized protein YyaL (SSP411 family)